jgi:Fe2+ transport system protein FeoA
MANTRFAGATFSRNRRKYTMTAITETLANMPAPSSTRILSLDGPPAIVARLEALGLCAGREVRIVQRGEPYIVQVYGTRIGLAAGLARFIRVGEAPA